MKIYEIIRVIDSNVLFLSDHIDRLRNSLMFYKKVSLNMNEIYNNIFNIINESKDKNFNIKIEIDIESLKYTFLKFEGEYPTKKMYQKGVNIIVYNYFRANPEVKLEINELKEKMDIIKKKKKVYEILYVDDYKVFECSASNIFFIKGNKVYTPKGEDVLHGITRMKVMEVCSVLGYEVIEKDLYLKDINKMNSCFITGTSKNVLPVNKINLKKYNVTNKMLRKIMRKFEEFVKEDIE